MFKRRIYLDYASITPVDPRVMKEISKNSKEFSANPSSIYREGVLAHKQLESARSRIATCLEAHADEIYFTSGGTESNNMAIQGVLAAWSALNINTKPHIISTTIEHPSIRELLMQLEKQGRCNVTYVEVGQSGIVDPKEIKKVLKPETALVTVMYVNNEIGTIQPIHDIAKVIRTYKKDISYKDISRAQGSQVQNNFPYLHTDACQAAAYCTLRMPYLAADLLTLDGSKFYGPRSAGILYIRRGTRMMPIYYGGSQEKSLRPGTENVANASGLALALEICQQEKDVEVLRLTALRNELYECIKKAVPNVSINGAYPDDRLPNNLNICLPHMDAEFAVLKLDAKGVCVSSVTSCRAQSEDSSSYVIEAINSGATQLISGQDSPSCSKSSLRITLGRFTTKKDIKVASSIFIKVLTGMIQLP